MPLFFQKFQAFTEGLTPFSLNLGIHILFFCFCFFLFGIYVFVSKVFLNFIKKAIPEKTPPWLKILTKSLFFQKAIALGFCFVLFAISNLVESFFYSSALAIFKNCRFFDLQETIL